MIEYIIGIGAIYSFLNGCYYSSEPDNPNLKDAIGTYTINWDNNEGSPLFKSVSFNPSDTSGISSIELNGQILTINHGLNFDLTQDLTYYPNISIAEITNVKYNDPIVLNYGTLTVTDGDNISYQNNFRINDNSSPYEESFSIIQGGNQLRITLRFVK